MSEYNQQATTYTQSAVSDLIHSPEYRRKMERCTMYKINRVIPNLVNINIKLFCAF